MVAHLLRNLWKTRPALSKFCRSREGRNHAQPKKPNRRKAWLAISSKSSDGRSTRPAPRTPERRRPPWQPRCQPRRPEKIPANSRLAGWRERPLVERPIIKWPEPAPRPGADRFRSRMGVGDMMVSATTAINAQPFQFGCALGGRPTVPQPCNHAPIEIGWVVAHPRARGSLLRSYRNFAPLALRSRCGLASLKGQHGD